VPVAPAVAVTHAVSPSKRWLVGLLLVLLALPMLPSSASADAFETVYFPVTGHHVSEPFLSTWRELGGLPTFGYPLSEPFEENGLLVQYFERERFEYHPENAGTEYEVLFGLLGVWKAQGKTDPAFIPLPADSTPTDPTNRRYFPETGHFLSNGFKQYWEANGGLRIFGYPISEEFLEDGYVGQYFERARFEWHPENAGTAYEILLGRLGADVAAANGVDTAAVPRRDGVPDYDERLFEPPPPPVVHPRSLDISVLMYHRFGDSADRYQTPCWTFAEQLDWLQWNGFTTITLSQLYDYIEGRGTIPTHPVVLTFDDGFGNQQCAVDALNARGMVGVFFITTNQNGLDLWSLAQHGHEIGSHTLSHPDLTTLSDAALWNELATSRRELQALSGQPVDILAYPYGAYDSRVIATAQAAGYRAAVAAWGGSWWTPDKWWFEPRIEVSGYATLTEFADLVR
jgi:peptidoglycan/xylan/chitin deacetylase (PgdA/CDA1 family)